MIRLMKFAQPESPDYPSDHVEDPDCCSRPPECVHTGYWVITEQERAEFLRLKEGPGTRRTRDQ